MTIDFDPDAHLYVVDGTPFPSVTHVIGTVVPYDASGFHSWCYGQGIRPEDYREKKAALGTRVHKAYESMALGYEVDPFDYPECEGFLDAIEDFVDKNDPEFHDAECKTASKVHGYAGTLDTFCTFRKGKYKGASARLDLKTGRVRPEANWPQLEAYEWAEVEQGKPASDVRLVLDVKATGKYRLVKSTDSFSDFKVLLDHYRSVEARKARKKR